MSESSSSPSRQQVRGRKRLALEPSTTIIRANAQHIRAGLARPAKQNAQPGIYVLEEPTGNITFRIQARPQPSSPPPAPRPPKGGRVRIVSHKQGTYEAARVTTTPSDSEESGSEYFPHPRETEFSTRLLLLGRGRPGCSRPTWVPPTTRYPVCTIHPGTRKTVVFPREQPDPAPPLSAAAWLDITRSSRCSPAAGVHR
ncbi:hypothetical protein ScPMuIL_003884 [Solemya velum]